MEVVGVLRLCGKECHQIHLVRGLDSTRGECGADRGAGEHDVAGVELLELRQRLQGLDGRVKHVALNNHVLAQLPVYPQLHPQVTEALELVGVEQNQRRPDLGKRRVRLRLVELGFGQLDIAR